MTYIKNRFNEEHRLESARLYVMAFKNKFKEIIGDEDALLELFVTGMNPTYALCAYTESGQLVGIAGYHVKKHGLVDLDLMDFVNTFGLIKGLFKGIITDFIFSRKPMDAKELLMDGIAVHEDFRGQGIGSQLFDALMDYAQSNDYHSIRLEVIDENPRAKKLYKNIGFKSVKYEKVPKIISQCIGVSGVTTMIKKL